MRPCCPVVWLSSGCLALGQGHNLAREQEGKLDERIGVVAVGGQGLSELELGLCFVLHVRGQDHACAV